MFMVGGDCTFIMADMVCSPCLGVWYDVWSPDNDVGHSVEY